MSFKDIKGHDGIIAFLKSSISCGKLANAYLFCGPAGIGKKLTALNFAKAINCRTSVDGSGCDSCPSCKKIDSSNHPDVKLIAPEKEGASVKIDDIRVVIKDIGLKPYEAGKKVYIIDDANYLTEEAANALLKTLEEPSSDSTLILIAEDPGQLLPTIRSRCHAVKFFLLGAPAIEEILTTAHKVDSVMARVLARISCGSLAEALKLKDEDIFTKRERIIKALSSNMFSEMDFDKTSRAELRNILNIMLTWYRDILITKAGRSNIINIDKERLISSAASRIELNKLDKIMKQIISTQGYLEQSANPKLAMAALGMEL